MKHFQLLLVCSLSSSPSPRTHWFKLNLQHYYFPHISITGLIVLSYITLCVCLHCCLRATQWQELCVYMFPVPGTIPQTQAVFQICFCSEPINALVNGPAWGEKGGQEQREGHADQARGWRSQKCTWNKRLAWTSLHTDVTERGTILRWPWASGVKSSDAFFPNGGPGQVTPRVFKFKQINASVKNQVKGKEEGISTETSKGDL